MLKFCIYFDFCHDMANFVLRNITYYFTNVIICHFTYITVAEKEQAL